jgi:hypothetical protein
MRRFPALRAPRRKLHFSPPSRSVYHHSLGTHRLARTASHIWTIAAHPRVACHLLRRSRTPLYTSTLTLPSTSILITCPTPRCRPGPPCLCQPLGFCRRTPRSALPQLTLSRERLRRAGPVLNTAIYQPPHSVLMGTPSSPAALAAQLGFLTWLQHETRGTWLLHRLASSRRRRVTRRHAGARALSR